MQLDDITKKILQCAFNVHSALGPGLLKSVYELCLFYEFQESGLNVERQKAFPVLYKTIKLDAGFRADIVVESKVIVEIMSIKAIEDVHIAQLLTYLKVSGCKVGLLINFNVKSLREGIKRVIV